jgi:hypothetical protein
MNMGIQGAKPIYMASSLHAFLGALCMPFANIFFSYLAPYNKMLPLLGPFHNHGIKYAHIYNP